MYFVAKHVQFLMDEINEHTIFRFLTTVCFFVRIKMCPDFEKAEMTQPYFRHCYSLFNTDCLAMCRWRGHPGVARPSLQPGSQPDPAGRGMAGNHPKGLQE